MLHYGLQKRLIISFFELVSRGSALFSSIIIYRARPSIVFGFEIDSCNI